MIHTLLVCCSDPRLDKLIERQRQIIREGGEVAYMIRVLGSTLSLMESKGQQFFEQQLHFVRDHGPVRRVIVMHHHDCQYCAYFKRFPDFDSEKEWHLKRMEAAITQIKGLLGDEVDYVTAYGFMTEDDESGDGWVVAKNSEITVLNR
jgi:carbonic anhydrase